MDNWSTNDTPASPPFHEKISYQDTPIISKIDGGHDVDHCALVTKMQDTDERMTQKMMPKTSDIDHRNLISLTHSPHMNSPTVSSDIDYRAFPGIPMPPSPPTLLMDAVKLPKDNVESVDMDLSDDDEKPKSNLDQKHPVLLPPPLPPPMPFKFEPQSVPDVVNQWDQSSQQWSNERSSFNGSQWNIEQQLQQQQPPPPPPLSEHWKHPIPNQWEQESNDLNFTHNQPPRQWPQHDSRGDQLKGDFRPRWKRGNSNWTRGPRNFNQNSRPGGRWNQGPHLGPRNQPW